MSRTLKSKPSPGTDWWGRRPFSTWAGPGKGSKRWKKLTHRIERARAKAAVRKEQP